MYTTLEANTEETETQKISGTIATYSMSDKILVSVSEINKNATKKL